MKSSKHAREAGRVRTWYYHRKLGIVDFMIEIFVCIIIGILSLAYQRVVIVIILIGSWLVLTTKRSFDSDILLSKGQVTVEKVLNLGSLETGTERPLGYTIYKC